MQRRKLKLHVITGSQDSAIYLYRMFWPYRWVKIPEADDWDLSMSPILQEPQLLGTKPTIAGAPPEDPSPPDVVVVSREVNAATLVALVRAKQQLGIRYVYDVDDNLFELPLWNPKYSWFAQDSVRTNLEIFLRHADAIFVSTEGLREKYAHLNPTIYVLPNSVDFVPIFPRPRNSRSRVVGWVGSHFHDGDFAIVEPTLLDLARNGLDAAGDTRVRVMYRVDYDPKDAPFLDQVHAVTWMDYFQTLALCDLDVGLVPLEDHPFNAVGKSANRYVEQAAVGTLTIASAIGEFARQIEHGRTGILVGEGEDWSAVTRAVLRDPDAIDRMTGAALEDVVARFDVRKNRAMWANALREVVSKPPRAVPGRYVLGTG